MNQSGIDIKKWLGAVLLAAAGVMTVYMAISTNSEISRLNEYGLSLQTDYASTNQKLAHVAKLLNKIPDAEHKHILASSRKDKDQYTKEITAFQNELLSQIYDLEKNLTEDDRRHLYGTKEAFAFYTANSMKVQDYSYKGMRSKAWELSQKESEPGLKSAEAHIDSLRERLYAANILYKQEFEQQAHDLKSAAYNKLYFALFFVIAAVVLFLFGALKNIVKPSGATVPAWPKTRAKNIVEPRSQSVRSTDRESAPQYSGPDDGLSLAARTPAGQGIDNLEEMAATAKNVEAELRERNEVKSRTKGMLAEAAEISVGMGAGEGSISDFGKLFDNSRIVIGLLESVSEMSTSSITDAQEIAVKVAKVGEYEVRKLASGALSVAREIQKLMLNNYNKIVDSVREAERVGQQLQGTIENVRQVSQVLEQARGTEGIISSLEDLMQKSGTADETALPPEGQVEEPVVPDIEGAVDGLPSESANVGPSPETEISDDKVDDILADLDVGETQKEEVVPEVSNETAKASEEQPGSTESTDPPDESDQKIRELSDDEMEEALSNTGIAEQEKQTEEKTNGSLPDLEENIISEANDELLESPDKETEKEKQSAEVI